MPRERQHRKYGRKSPWRLRGRAGQPLAPLPRGQLILDIFLPELMRQYHNMVWDALYELHLEKGCNASFKPEEVAVRAGLRREIVERILWRLWQWQMLVKRRGNRYKIRDGLLKECYALAAAVAKAKKKAGRRLDGKILATP